MLTLRPVLLMAVVMSVCASGCSNAADVRSVDFYEKNDDARARTLTRCKALEADAAKDADCVNAQRAAFVAANKKQPIPKTDFSKVPVAK